MKRSNWFVALVIVCSVLATSVALAEVKLPSVIGDHMVLQQSMPLAIWCQAEPGEKVTVSIQSQTATAVTDTDGHWQVKLDAMRAGGPFEMTMPSNFSFSSKTEKSCGTLRTLTPRARRQRMMFCFAPQSMRHICAPPLP